MNIVYLVVTTPDLQRIAAVRNGPTGHALPRWDDIGHVPPSDRGPRLPALATCVGPTDIVHWAALPPQGPGVSGARYCLAVTQQNDPKDQLYLCEDTTLEERETLLTGNTLTPEERSVLLTALARLESPSGPFDSQIAVKAAIAWAGRQIAETTGARIGSLTRYRQQRHDLVIRFDTDRGVLYLKAGRNRFADEAILTQQLEALVPDLVPKTVAVDALRHRWLYQELPGVMLSQTALERDTVVAAIRAMAALQQATIGSQAIAQHLANRRQTAVSVFDAIDAEIERAWHSVRRSDALGTVAGAWQSLRQRMRGGCAAVDGLDIPPALVPSDLGTHNIVVTPAGIGFIDLGHSYWSCPMLPLWRFVRDLKRRFRVTDAAAHAAMCHAIGTAFIDAWRPHVPPDVMTRALGHMWLIGRLFGMQIAACDLDIYEEAIGTTLPDGFRAARLAPRVRDLLQAFARHAVTPGREPVLSSALDL